MNAHGKLFINCATISPEVHVEVEKLRATRPARQRSKPAWPRASRRRAKVRSISCAAAAKENFERAEPILKELGSSIRYIGKSGEAAKVKALVNMVMNINTAGLAEGLGLGDALGLDLTMLREVFGQTGAASRVLQTDGEDMQNRDHACFFSAAHAAKDSGIALHLAKDRGLDLAARPRNEGTIRRDDCGRLGRAGQIGNR